MEDWGRKRKEWSNARDKLGVPKGAVSGISLGDAIDKVAKAMAKGYKSLLSAVEKFLVTAEKYRVGVAKKHPKVASWVEKNLLASGQELKAQVMTDMRSVKWIAANVLKADGASGEIGPDSGNVPTLNKYLKDHPGAKWAEAAKAVGLFDHTHSSLKALVPIANGLAKVEWMAELPAQAASYKAIKEYHTALTNDLKFFIGWTKVTSSEEDNKMRKAMISRSDSRMWSDAMKKAVATLAA